MPYEDRCSSFNKVNIYQLCTNVCNLQKANANLILASNLTTLLTILYQQLLGSIEQNESFRYIGNEVEMMKQEINIALKLLLFV